MPFNRIKDTKTVACTLFNTELNCILIPHPVKAVKHLSISCGNFELLGVIS